ncbi:MAG: FHA domain-containing protein [Bacteroidota bacterium]
MIQRPTARDILEALVQALHGAQEPFDDDLVLVPAFYEVRLHPDVYLELKALMPRIQAQAQKRLDAELARLSVKRGLLSRLADPVLRWFSADRYLRGRSRAGLTYERSGAAWQIEFGVTDRPEADLGFLAIETDFGMRAAAEYRGQPTINIRRTTRRLPTGGFETVLSAARPGRSTQEIRTPGARAVLARLRYEDRQGEHVYYMQKAEIVIGRQDEGGTALDIALDTLADVSREHLRIRHEEAATGSGFWAQDVSQFGVTVNGAPLTSGTAAVATEVWQPLPAQAEIGLAGVVFIDFEAL